MEALDHYTLCNVASYLDLNSFRRFVWSCRAFAGCRDDPRTLAYVALNTDMKHPERVVFTLFGSAAIRFFVTKCDWNMVGACYSAIWVAVRRGDDFALRILAPLCDRRTVESTLSRCDDDIFMALDALKYFDVSPDFSAKLLERLSFWYSGILRTDVFDVVNNFDLTGELPPQLNDFIDLANAILESGYLGWIGRLVLALTETDASGALKDENITRAVALLEKPRQVYDVSMKLHDETNANCLHAYLLLRQYADMVTRLFAIVPRPLTLSQQLNLTRLFYLGCLYERLQGQDPFCDFEADQVLYLFHTCCRSPDCVMLAVQRQLKLWVLAHWSDGPLSDQVYRVLAECIFCETGDDNDAMVRILIHLHARAGASTAIKDRADERALFDTNVQSTAQLYLAMMHLSAHYDLDVTRLITALFDVLYSKQTVYMNEVGIIEKLNAHRLCDHVFRSFPDWFVRSCEAFDCQTKWKILQAIEVNKFFNNAALPADVIAAGILALCRQHGIPEAEPDPDYEEFDEPIQTKIRLLIGSLFLEYFEQCVACVPQCESYAKEHNDTVLLAMFRSIVEHATLARLNTGVECPEFWRFLKYNLD